MGLASVLTESTIDLFQEKFMKFKVLQTVLNKQNNDLWSSRGTNRVAKQHSISDQRSTPAMCS